MQREITERFYFRVVKDHSRSGEWQVLKESIWADEHLRACYWRSGSPRRAWGLTQQLTVYQLFRKLGSNESRSKLGVSIKMKNKYREFTGQFSDRVLDQSTGGPGFNPHPCGEMKKEITAPLKNNLGRWWNSPWFPYLTEWQQEVWGTAKWLHLRNAWIGKEVAEWYTK